jgi:hypothetical protein
MDGPRLPDYVQPNHYDLHIMTDMTAFTFKGTAEIDITVRAPCTLCGTRARTDVSAFVDARVPTGDKEGNQPNRATCAGPRHQ